MGFDYLRGSNWIDITREERFFCAYSYFDIKKDVNRFILWLNKNTIPCNKSVLNFELGDWEVGYEACFYRDLRKINENVPDILSKFKEKGCSLKRTFDICLFNERRIVVIEAKVHQSYDSEQIEHFKKDREKLPSILEEIVGRKIGLDIVALASSEYDCKEDTKKNFNAYVTWKQISDEYIGADNKNVYLLADMKYRK
jgi:hypothetical protein